VSSHANERPRIGTALTAKRERGYRYASAIDARDLTAAGRSATDPSVEASSARGTTATGSDKQR
jgi:hypothetical protein